MLDKTLLCRSRCRTDYSRKLLLILSNHHSEGILPVHCFRLNLLDRRLLRRKPCRTAYLLTLLQILNNQSCRSTFLAHWFH